ncbi:hypothetical protein HDV00_006721 [Rhizophlyctis rosea]|nr:hypothetical protein HDV00_006721 [Rhizophlyctis rosea]
MAYKKGTSTVLTSIVSAAAAILPPKEFAALTVPASPISNKPAPQAVAGGRLKGKDRKAAKEATATNGAKLPPLPSDVLFTLKKVLELRKDFRAFYVTAEMALTGEEREKLEAHNVSHQHFIGVLERAFFLFSGVAKKLAQKVAAEEKEGKTVAALSNQFDVLGVDEPQEDAEEDVLEPAPIASPPPKRQPPINPFALQEGRDSEVLLAAWCMYTDLKNIRQFLNGLWTEYLSAYSGGQATITELTLSAISSVAMNLVESLEKNMKTYPELNTFVKWFKILGLIIGEGDVPHPYTGKLPYFAKGINEVGLAGPYLSLCEVLRGTKYQAGSRSSSRWELRLATGGRIDDNHFRQEWDRPQLSSTQQDFEDFHLIVSQIGDWVAINHVPPKYKVNRTINCDTVLKYLKDWQHSGDADNPSVTFLFALQLTLDAVDIMRPFLPMVARRAHLISKKLTRSVNEFVAYDLTATSIETKSNAKAHSDAVSRSLVTPMLGPDFVFHCRLLWEGFPGVDETNSTQSFLINNPWLAVGSIEQACSTNHDLGRHALTESGFMINAMHGYNALRQKGYLAEPIPFFEFLMKTWGDRVFMGPPPTEGFYTRLKLKLGTSASSFSKGKKGQSGNFAGRAERVGNGM